MAVRPYHFLTNSFLHTTRSNYKKMLVLGTDHAAKLAANQSDAVIATILAAFAPVWQTYLATDLNLRIVLGDYKGETLTVEQLFELLNSDHLPDWDAAVQVQFRKRSTTYTALWPQQRKPFQSGTYASRIQEIEALGNKCALIPALQPLSVLILAFHTQIESARQVQQSTGKGQLLALRTLREQARVALCTAMLGNLGLLLHHYQANPLQVANYFDFPLLRRKTKAGQGSEDEAEV